MTQTVRNLALQYPSSSLYTGPLLIYLTARSSARGEDAVKTLLSDPQLKAVKALTQDGGLTTITFSSLDICDEESLQAFESSIKRDQPEGIDILINNAGIFKEATSKTQDAKYQESSLIIGADEREIQNLLKTNYYGTLSMMKAFLPMLRTGGRMVNVASEDGELSLYSPPIQQAFISASKNSIPACTALVEDFVASVKERRQEPEGWPVAAYGYALSKAGVIAATKVIAMEPEKNGGKVSVNACCPGFVNTEMTRGHGVLSPDEGAKTPVLLALGDLNGVSGKFWKDGIVAEWFVGE